MSARIEGKPEPTIQWLKDGVDVSSNSDYLTTYLNCTASLRIDETFVDDSGLYTVKASNGAGQAQSSAKLTVKCRLSDLLPFWDNTAFHDVSDLKEADGVLVPGEDDFVEIVKGYEILCVWNNMCW